MTVIELDLPPRPTTIHLIIGLSVGNLIGFVISESKGSGTRFILYATGMIILGAVELLINHYYKKRVRKIVDLYIEKYSSELPNQ